MTFIFFCQKYDKIKKKCDKNYFKIVLIDEKINEGGKTLKDNSINQSDIKLYKDFLKGDDNAFNELVLKHRKLLTMFIAKYVKNIDIAEDIVQNAFVYMLINRVDYDFKYSFKTYLYTIAKSRAVNYLKKKKKFSNIDDYFNILFVNDLEDNYIASEEKALLKNAISKLKKEYQIVIYLYEYQGFKYEEISKILNQGMSKTKMTLHRAKKALKKILKGE